MQVKKSHLITAIIVAISILFIIVLINPFKKNLWDLNSKLLKEKVVSAGQTVETLNLSDITPFEWEKVYSFDPYMPKDKIYSVIGYKWDNISETVSEGMNQIVFLNGGKVVCYLYGYPSNNGYGISFDSTDYKDGVATFNLNDNLNFKITKTDNILYLKQVK